MSTGKKFKISEPREPMSDTEILAELSYYGSKAIYAEYLSLKHYGNHELAEKVLKLYREELAAETRHGTL